MALAILVVELAMVDLVEVVVMDTMMAVVAVDIVVVKEGLQS